MASRDWLPSVKYRWDTGSGHWASARQAWAGLPGRRFPARVSTTREPAVTIAYQGFPDGITYLLPYLLEQQAVVCGPATLSDPPPASWGAIRGRAATDGEADILVVGCSARRAARLAGPRSVVLPFKVRMLLDVVPDPQAMLAKVSANERRQFVNLRRRHEWEVEIGTEPDDLLFFYERMHLPTMATRHGEDTRSTDWDIALRCLFRKGMLLFVTEGGKRVAGVLCRFDDGGATLRMRLLGALDGDETHYRSGAVKAVYYLTMEWAAANGVSLLDFSTSDPFPGRGVFQFKRRFHPRIALPADHFRDRRVVIRACRDTPAVRDLLAATPMLTVDAAGRLAATHFFDQDRPVRSRIRATGPGVEVGHEVDLDEFFGRVTAPHATLGAR
jgi:GNAT acetyltransferase-like protein